MSNNPNIVHNATSISSVATVNNLDYSFNSNLNNNNNNQDFSESISRALDQTKDNINRSIEESKNQIPQYNNIVNSYQEQTLQAAKEISENFIESQKTIINSIQSAWRPFNERFITLNENWNSPDAVANVYSRFVSIFADNAVSIIRVTNNTTFSNMDSWKSVLQQAKDNLRQLSNLSVNSAKIFEQNSKQIDQVTAQSIQTNNDTNTTITNAQK
jgi:hypothetical protein